MKKHRIKAVIILGSLSLIGIIIFQVFWIYNTFKSNENLLNKNIVSALNQVAFDLADFNKNQSPQLNPTIQTSPDHFVVNIEDEINPIILEHFLETNFEKKHIQLDYEYAIYDCESDSMVHIKRINVSGKKHKDLEEANFKKLTDYNYYFSIRFPGKTAAILFGMNVWYISAFLLITALLFFVYAIAVMLGQKRFSEVQKDFINNMTHELKTPISTIGISAKVIADPEIIKQPERLQNYAQIIVNQNQRMEKQVEKVLQSTLAEKSRIQLELEPIDLQNCISRIVKEFEVKAQERGSEITLHFPESIPEIQADQNHFENMIINLLDNAVKYSEDMPTVEVVIRQVKNHLEIVIIDQGIGMEKKQLNKIFQKFYRIPTGDIHNVKGFGLGLNYVKNIVKAHKWSIEVKSEPGKGSEFRVIIPIKKQ
jgi:two-component system phosphate regulon sensor histidine kinase PhoR